MRIEYVFFKFALLLGTFSDFVSLLRRIWIVLFIKTIYEQNMLLTWTILLSVRQTAGC